MTHIKRGTARRLSLRSPQSPMPIGLVNGTPHGVLTAVVGQNNRTWLQNQRGSAVHNPGVLITAGMVNQSRNPVNPDWQRIPAGPR